MAKDFKSSVQTIKRVLNIDLKKKKKILSKNYRLKTKRGPKTYKKNMLSMD